MKTEKTINLTAYVVEYIDQREPKPRTVHSQTVVLDGGKISALARLDMRPAGWITQQFERNGYTVASIHKGETIAAHIKKHRMEEAALRLKKTTEDVSAIAKAVGFESPSRFCAVFRETFGLSPGEYRRAQAEMSGSEEG